jgi:23S rRNA G2445 N2-methylase RlmL
MEKKRPPSWPSESLEFRGLLIANPPYGERMQLPPRLYGDLFQLYRSLGSGWRAAFIVANEDFEAAFRAKPSMKKPIWNGPIRAWALVYGD